MSTIYISETANPLLIDYLEQQGHIIKIVEISDITYKPVSSHPDIYMCSMGPGKPVFFGYPEKIGSKYPENIIFNAACTGKYFIHNTKYTDPELLEYVKKQASDISEEHADNFSINPHETSETLEIIDVPQGYTKCNTLIVDEYSIITSDVGIYNSCYGRPHLTGNDAAAEDCKSCISGSPAPQLEVLLIEKGHIKLQGFDYGFIGGASGRVGDTIIFNGDITQHPDYEKITAFIESRGLKIKHFTGYPLEDIGSIIECYQIED